MYMEPSKMVAVILVAMLLVGAVVIVIMIQNMGDIDHDPHYHNDDYTFTGTFEGLACTGTGTSEYSQESAVDYVYYLTYLLDNGSKREKFQVPLVFKHDETMDPNHYEDLGTDTLDGKQVHVWRWSPSGTVYTLWVGDLCTVMKITIQSDRMDVTGTIVKK